MTYTVYLSGEIHSSWRQDIVQATADLDIRFTAPVTDHPASDAAGDFLGSVEPGFLERPTVQRRQCDSNSP